jgi:hypothetical protein
MNHGLAIPISRGLVPLQQMRFDDLSDAQNMIEQAAVLQQKGVGV